jgi:maltose alpha-D-glucosyltransferase/alpha-amylase
VKEVGRAAAGALPNDPLWYKDAIIYEVRTLSYFDGNGDGIGDIAGLTSKLDYLADLGITALWVLPQYPSPGRDDGYDIADYTDIHPDVGTLEDFDELVLQAHRRGIRIITELVLNHSSDQHPWFQRARRAPPGSPEREFYVWSDTTDRYADARIIFRDFEPSNWTWDPVAKAYFWHRFYAHQPDLNFENPAVHEAVLAVVDFWLARGVDGLRLDAVPYLYEQEGTNCENLPATHAFLKKLRAHVDAKFENRLLLAEANQWPEDAARYFGEGDECHMNFHFPIMPRLFMAIHMEDRFPIIDILRQTPDVHPTCQWAMFLRNHDELTLEMVTDDERDYMYRAYAHEAQMRINLGIRRRLAPLTGNDRRTMELLDGLLFSMPGTPVLYYGDEIGMGDNVYLGDRNGVRTPMQWSADRNAGFSRANPQRLILPIIIDPEYHYEALNVEAQQTNPNSLLWWTKRLIALRKRFRAFGRGAVDFLTPANPRVLAFVRRWEDELVLVVANLSRHVQVVELDLSAMKGMLPVELMGRTRFPTIGELPYMLTLGGHDFYWFSLEHPRLTAEAQLSSVRGPPTLACTSVYELLFGDERERLEAVLPAFLHARGWLAGAVHLARIADVVRLGDVESTPTFLVFVEIEYADAEGESFALPLVLVPGESPPLSGPLSGPLSAPPASVPVGGGPTVALLSFTDAATGDEGGRGALVEATGEQVARVLVAALARGARVRAPGGTLIAASWPGAPIEPENARDARIVDSDRFEAAIACGTSYVLRVLRRVEAGVAPEVEVGRLMHARGVAATSARFLGHVEYRVPRREPMTLAVLEEYVAHEGTAWEQARSELGRAYERVLAHPTEDPPPDLLAAQSLFELANEAPAGVQRELIGTYRDSAALLGRRLAELHVVLASSTEPAFEPRRYASLDQRSKYQSARNLVGRVLGTMRRTLGDLPPNAHDAAVRVLSLEDVLLRRFDALRTERLDGAQIRLHGNLQLDRALFTGRDYVLIGVGGGREHTFSERRRKATVFRDVAAMIRSFHYAAATSHLALRPEDQARAEPWGWIWHLWASAAFVGGYLEVAGEAPFVSQRPEARRVLLETSILSKALRELHDELRARPTMAWIPLQAILRTLGVP